MNPPALAFTGLCRVSVTVAVRSAAIAAAVFGLLLAVAPSAFAACAASSSAYKSVVTGTPGVVGFWRMDETTGSELCDSVGSQAGTYGSGVSRGHVGATSDGNAAAGFDGTLNAYATVDDAPALNPTFGVTVEAWVKPSTVANGYYTTVRKDGQYMLRLYGDNLYFRVWLPGGMQYNVEAFNVLDVDQWQHVVGTFDGSLLRVFRNGEQVAAVSVSGALQTTTNPLSIARDTSGAADYFRGQLDDISVYGRGLSAGEVLEHYEVGSGPRTVITAAPEPETNSSSASLTFESPEAGASFECRIDGGTWSACSSPKTYGSLADGRHSFEARAVVNGFVDRSPPERSWTVESLALRGVETLHSTGAELRWARYHGSGFDSYEVHRGVSPGFVPAASTRLAIIRDQGVWTYEDTSAKPGGTFTYKLLVNGAAAGQQTVTLPAPGMSQKTLYSGDTTFVASDAACTNYGGSNYLRVGPKSDGGVQRALVYFDLRDIGATATVTSATLSLRASAAPTVATTVRAHRALAQWAEGTAQASCKSAGVSWKQGAAATPWRFAGGDWSPDAAAEITHPGGTLGSDQFDLTALVQDWAGAVQANHGVVLRAADETAGAGKYVQYRSDEYATSTTERPKLAVTYSDGRQVQKPQVSMTAPRDGARVRATVDVTATALDDRRVDLMQFFVDGTAIGADSTEPYGTSWDTTAESAGAHTLTARATDDAGNVATSSPVNVTVDNSDAPTVAVSSPAPSYAATVAEDAPVGHWRLGESAGTSAADASGNGRTGTYSGSFTLGRSSLLVGDGNAAALFRSTSPDGVVTLSGLAGLLGSQLTAEAWVDYGGVTVEGADNTVFRRGWGSSGGWRLIAYKSSSTGLQRVYFQINQGGTVTSATTTVAPGLMHLAATYDGSTMRLFVNGEQQASAALAGAVLTTSATARIGESITDDMTVDEAALYSAALSAARLAAHYEAGAGVQGTTTVKATAADDVGVSKVEFYVDDVLFGESRSAPHEASLDTAALSLYDGAHTITARAHDSAGQATTSAPVSVRVANGGGKYLQKLTSTAAPPSMVHDPAAGAMQEKASFTVTVENSANRALAASDVVLRYRWVGPDGVFATSDAEVALGGDLPAGGLGELAPVVVEAPVLQPGEDRLLLRLRFDLYEKSTGRWFSDRGGQPLEHAITVNRKQPIELGLERYYQYEGEELGAGMQHLVNLASGNSVIRWTPWSTTNRGVSTVLDLTYNSREQNARSPLGNSWSLALSSLTRFGEQLDDRPGKYLEFTDGDGTRQRFAAREASDGSVYWVEPAGTRLYLRKLRDGDPLGTWALTRPDMTTFYFDGDGYPKSVRDGNGEGLTFTLETTPPGEDPLGPKKRVTEVIGAGGRKHVIAYYAKAEAKQAHVRGKVKQITDPSGSRLTFDYYDDGNLLRITQRGGLKADGQPLEDRRFVFTYTEQSSGDPRLPNGDDRVDPDPRTSAQSSRIFSVRDPRGNETTFGYLPAGAGEDRFKLSSRTDREARTTNYSYESAARRATVVAPAGRTSEYLFDADGSIREIIDPLKGLTKVEWTAQRQVSKITEPSAEITPVTQEFAYDDNGYLIKYLDQEGRNTTLTYEYRPVDGSDVAGKWAAGRTQPHLSFLDTKTDPAGTGSAGAYQWRFDFDQSGNLQSVSDPDGGATAYAYYANGDLETATDQLGRPTGFFDYDDSGQPRRVIEYGTAADRDRTTRFAYDADGLIRWVQRPRQAEKSAEPVEHREYRSYFDYDEFHRLGRQSTPLDGDRGEIVYSQVDFDANDNVKTEFAPHLGAATDSADRTTTTYDKMDRPEVVTGPEPAPDPATGQRPQPRYKLKRTEMRYDAAGRLDRITDPKGWITSFDYDALDRLLRTRRDHRVGAGTRTLVELRCYDAAGNLASVTAPKAALLPTAECPVAATQPYTTFLTYFRDHRLKSETKGPASAPRTKTYGYDDNGDLDVLTDEQGAQWTYGYNQRRLLTKYTEPFKTLPVEGRFVYDAAGNVTQQVSPRARALNGDLVDYAGRPLVAEHEYNGFGELVTTSLPYDPDFRSPIDASVHSSQVLDRHYVYRAYDDDGNLVRSSLPVPDTSLPLDSPKWTVNEYFDTGWLRKSTQPGGTSARFEYTPQGWQSRRVPVRGGTDDLARQSTWTYFPDGTVAEERDRRGLTTKHTYDANGNLEESQSTRHLETADELPMEFRNAYDDLDRLTEVRHRELVDSSRAAKNWNVTSYGYDDNGNVIELVENRVETPGETPSTVQAGRRQSYVYDSGDLLEAADDYGDDGDGGFHRRYDYGYSATGLRTSRMTRAGAGTRSVLRNDSWAYYPNGLLRSQQTRGGDPAQPILEVHDLEYGSGAYSNGFPTKDRFRLAGPEGKEVPCDDVECVTEWRYDPRDRLHQEIRRRPTTPRMTEFTHDGAGNLLYKKVDGATPTVFVPRSDGVRLAYQKAGDGGGVLARFYYTGGNLSCITDGQLDVTGEQIRQTQQRCEAFEGGDTGFAGLVEFKKYDGQDRLRAQRSYRPDNKVLGKSDYTYDLFDRPVKQVDAFPDPVSGALGDGSRTTGFTYLGLTRDLSAEQHVSVVGARPRTKTFAYDPFGERVAMTDDLPEDNGRPAVQRQYGYVHNPQGSVSLLLKGDVPQASYGYSAYGDSDKTEAAPGETLTHEVDPDSATGTDETKPLHPLNPIRYTDKRRDAATNTLDMGARRFGPAVSSFLQEDLYEGALENLSLGEDPVTANRYSLAGGNPVGFTEADGHEPVTSYRGDAKQVIRGIRPRSKYRGTGIARVWSERADGNQSGRRRGPDSYYDSDRSSSAEPTRNLQPAQDPKFAEIDDASPRNLARTLEALTSAPTPGSLGAQAIKQVGEQTVKRLGPLVRKLFTRGDTAAKGADDVAGATARRADELQGALPEGAQGRVTMGVGAGRDAQGNLRTVVGTSEPRGYLRPGVTLRPGEELARGFGHAEDDIVSYMLRNDISPLSVSAGRPICPRCGRLIGGAGARPGSRLR